VQLPTVYKYPIVVSGEVVFRDGDPTAAMPDKVVRDPVQLNYKQPTSKASGGPPRLHFLMTAAGPLSDAVTNRGVAGRSRIRKPNLYCFSNLRKSGPQQTPALPYSGAECPDLKTAGILVCWAGSQKADEPFRAIPPTAAPGRATNSRIVERIFDATQDERGKAGLHSDFGGGKYSRYCTGMRPYLSAILSNNSLMLRHVLEIPISIQMCSIIFLRPYCPLRY